jgi:hypothetical protein
VPLRIVQKDGAELVDLRLLDSTNLVTRDALPHVIAEFRGGKLVRSSEVVRVNLNPDLADNMFLLGAATLPR